MKCALWCVTRVTQQQPIIDECAKTLSVNRIISYWSSVIWCWVSKYMLRYVEKSIHDRLSRKLRKDLLEEHMSLGIYHFIYLGDRIRRGKIIHMISCLFRQLFSPPSIFTPRYTPLSQWPWGDQTLAYGWVLLSTFLWRPITDDRINFCMRKLLPLLWK